MKQLVTSFSTAQITQIKEKPFWINFLNLLAIYLD